MDFTVVRHIPLARGIVLQHIQLAPGGTAVLPLQLALGDAAQHIPLALGIVLQHIQLAPGGTAVLPLQLALGDVVQPITLVPGIMEAVVTHILLVVDIMEVAVATHIPPVEGCMVDMGIVTQPIQRAPGIMDYMEAVVAPHILLVHGIVPAFMVDMEVLDLEAHLLMLPQLYRRFDHNDIRQELIWLNNIFAYVSSFSGPLDFMSGGLFLKNMKNKDRHSYALT